jgi:hypothetical protein
VVASAGFFLLLACELTYRQFLPFGVGLLAVICVIGGRRGLALGLLGFIWTFALGYRTFAVTQNLQVHPSELILWGLLALVLVLGAVGRDRGVSYQLPLWILLFVPFWLWGWMVGLAAGRPWDIMAREFADFLLLVPLYLVSRFVLSTEANWKHVVAAFFGAGALIGLLGLLEHSFLGVREMFPQFMTPFGATLTGEGFRRAAFGFWGGPAATFVCVLAVPMIAPLWQRASSVWMWLLLTAGLIVQVAGIYVGGYRSAWLLVVIELGLLAFLKRRAVLVLALVIAGMAGYLVLGDAGRARAESMKFALQGDPIDSSARKRAGRASAAFSLALSEPWGQGWSGSGWVHSDFLQTAANLGIGAGLLFVGAYVWTSLRLWRSVWRLRRRASTRSSIAYALAPAFVGAGGLLATQGVQVLPQLILPVWFIWVLVEVWLRQPTIARSI